MTVAEDVLAVNHLMRQPVTEDECERVVHALGLANYEIRKRPPEKATSDNTRLGKIKAQLDRIEAAVTGVRDVT